MHWNDKFDYSHGVYSDCIEEGYKNIIDFKEYAPQLIHQKVLDLGFKASFNNYIARRIEERKNSKTEYKMFTTYGLYNQTLILEKTNLKFVLLWFCLRAGVHHLMFHENCPDKPKKYRGKEVLLFPDRYEFISVRQYPEHSFPHIAEVLGQRITEIHLLQIRATELFNIHFPDEDFPSSLHYYKGNLAVRFTFENGHSIAVGSGLMDTPMYVKGGMLLIPFEMVDQTKVEEMIKIA